MSFDLGVLDYDVTPTKAEVVDRYVAMCEGLVLYDPQVDEVRLPSHLKGGPASNGGWFARRRRPK